MGDLSEHFSFGELLGGRSVDAVPEPILTNCNRMQNTLELARSIVRRRFRIHRCYTPGAMADGSGGKRPSDHGLALATDFDVLPNEGENATWQELTIAAYLKLRLELPPRSFGQLIVEDRRIANVNDHELLLHLSCPTDTHPGTAEDPTRIMISRVLGAYRPYDGSLG